MSDPLQATGNYQTYNCANWQVLNESAGGVALAWGAPGWGRRASSMGCGRFKR